MSDIVERLRNTSKHGIFTASMTDNYASYGEAADAIIELRKALSVFLGHDDRFHIAIGGNPRAIDEMMASARALIGDTP